MLLFYRLLHTALYLFLYIFLGSRKVYGRENVPEKGPYIIVVNHMSKADTALLLLSLPLQQYRFFAAEKWESHWFFGPIMRWGGAAYIKRGKVDRKALKEAMQALEEGAVFGLAPEGTRSQTRQLQAARDGAAYLASRTNVPILPIGVVNTEIIGDNIKRLRRTRLETHIGKPFYLPDLGRRPRSSDLDAYTHLIMAHIANLLPEQYHGYYKDSPALAALRRGEDPWPYCWAAAAAQQQTID